MGDRTSRPRLRFGHRRKARSFQSVRDALAPLHAIPPRARRRARLAALPSRPPPRTLPASAAACLLVACACHIVAHARPERRSRTPHRALPGSRARPHPAASTPPQIPCSYPVGTASQPDSATRVRVTQLRSPIRIHAVSLQVVLSPEALVRSGKRDPITL